MRPGPEHSLILLLGLCALLSTFNAGADEPVAPGEPRPAPVETDEATPSESFVTFDYTGYFRWRNDLFYRPDLGAGVGGFRAGLEDTDKNKGLGETSDVLAGTNIRLRFSPTARVGQSFRIHAQLDILDNLVLGSTPDYHPDRPDVPLSFFTDGQAGVSDAIAVKQLWLEWEILKGIVFSVGRMADPVGLGMVTSGGEGLDSDFGDYTDRVVLLMRAFGLHSQWFFDSPFEGATTRSRIDGYGQASDISSVDDAIRWGFTLGMRPLDLLEEEQRERDLRAGKPSLQWVIRNAFITHEFQSELETDPIECSEDNPAFSYDCIELFPRKASLWVPDIWLRLDVRPRYDLEIRVELELAGLYGEFEFVQNIPDPESSKNFLGIGGVLQTEVRHQAMSYQLEFGAASGDDVAFGPNGPGFSTPDDAAYAQSDRLRNNKDITRFLFNRDYLVDLILYREILGAVTNSFYLKPSVGFTLLDTSEHRLGGTLAFLYAHAFLAESTPGQDNPLGFETDLNLFYEMPRKLRVDIDAGVLVPFSGLDNDSLGAASKTAFTLQARIAILF